MILLLTCLLSQLCFSAETVEVYVRNKLLQGEVLAQGGEVYVPAQELKKLLKEDLSWDENTGAVSIGGTIAPFCLMFRAHSCYLPLKATAKILGYEVAYNKSTGILDVFKKTALKQDQKPAGDGPAAAAPSTTAPGSPDKEKDLLTISEKGVQQDTSGSADGVKMVSSPHAGTHTNQVSANTDQGIRVTAVVSNGRATDARNITATCTLKTQDGSVYTKQDQPVGSLKAGEKSEVLFYFPAGGGGVPLQRSFSVKGE